MISNEIQHQIIVELRNGALDQWQIAGGIGQASFTVLAELKALKRLRLVQDHDRSGGLMWELTSSGYREAFHLEQLRLI